MFAVLTNNEWVVVIAIIFLCVAAVLCFSRDATANVWSRVLLAVGLAVFAFSFIVNP